MLKIINKTDLSYSTIGLIIDNIMENNTGNTMYYGKVEWTSLSEDYLTGLEDTLKKMQELENRKV